MVILNNFDFEKQMLIAHITKAFSNLEQRVEFHWNWIAPNLWAENGAAKKGAN